MSKEESTLSKHSVAAREVITYCCPFDQAATLIGEIFKDGSYRRLHVAFSGRDDKDKPLVHIDAEFELKAMKHQH